MRAADLGLTELLHFHPGGGLIRFAGQRAVIMDTAALGLLRRQLLDTLGEAGTRGVLTRFGYAHGWRTAEALETGFPWDDAAEWRRAGGRLHTLQGMVFVEGAPEQGTADGPFAAGTWHESFEAEQHRMLVGQADEPVCWMLTGFSSGYLSYCNDAEIYCVEQSCMGKGDERCTFVARPRAEWGAEIEPHLGDYQTGCLELALEQLTKALKATEARLQARREALAAEDARQEDPPGAVARSQTMCRVIDLAQRAARVDTTVLVTGESGVGKERVAHLVHEQSPRAKQPFLAVNCGAISETLIESELFGHAKGAFTGATQERAGLFEAAQGGTLFLDEVGELPAATQVKLLRVLQEREVRRVGENTSRAVDVRLIAATNRDLVTEVAAGRFRQDLLYRLKVIEVRVPPLRERKEDVLPLARTLLLDLAERLGVEVCSFTPQAADLLLRYPWPGNVRELSNAVERALVVATGDRIGPEDLPEELRGVPTAATPAPLLAGAARPLEDVEREHILAVLARNDGHRGKTASDLGIGPATLYRKLKKYGVD